MKSGITRWKIVPSYSLPWVGCLVRGSVHSRVPSARSTKFRTVLGAWSGKSRTVIVPRFVRSFAVSVFVMTGILARPGGQPASRPAHGAWVAAAAAVSHLHGQQVVRAELQVRSQLEGERRVPAAVLLELVTVDGGLGGGRHAAAIRGS